MSPVRSYETIIRPRLSDWCRKYGFNGSSIVDLPKEPMEPPEPEEAMETIITNFKIEEEERSTQNTAIVNEDEAGKRNQNLN